jgi:hypothetical protein
MRLRTRGYARKLLLLPVGILTAAIFMSAFEQPEVTVTATSVGPRNLEDQTKSAVVRDYLAAWQSMDRAFQENDPGLLDAEFVGTAKTKLWGTIQEQRDLGLATSYKDRKHDISLVFYSPEGLSIQLLDTVEYDVQILDHDKLQGTQHVRAHYVAVLTPTEVRWKVRVLQAIPGGH